MADINDINAAQSIKIIGSNSSGVETTPVNSSNNGALKTSDISNNGGVEGTLNVGTTPIEVKVGVSPFTERINVTVFNSSNTTIYWGYTNSVTIATGTPLSKEQFGSWAIGPNTSLYLIANSLNNIVRITESA